MIETKTQSAQETVDVGRALGELLNRGDVICLSGNLGTGKTAFTNGIASALGIAGYITSPTFTIVNEYKGHLPLYHFDVYRIADAEEMFEIGFEEYLDGNGVTVIEWPELIKDILPRELIWIEIKKDLQSGIDTRVIHIDFRGERFAGCEDKLKGRIRV